MDMNKYVIKIIPILKKYGVSRASLFGSVVRGEENDESDIDILVEIPKDMSYFEMLDIKFELEDKLKKKVDLIEYDLIKPRLKQYILKEQIKIL